MLFQLLMMIGSPAAPAVLTIQPVSRCVASAVPVLTLPSAVEASTAWPTVAAVEDTAQ